MKSIRIELHAAEMRQQNRWVIGRRKLKVKSNPKPTLTVDSQLQRDPVPYDSNRWKERRRIYLEAKAAARRERNGS